MVLPVCVVNCKNEENLALTSLEALLRLIDDVNAALATNHLVVTVPGD